MAHRTATLPKPGDPARAHAHLSLAVTSSRIAYGNALGDLFREVSREHTLATIRLESSVLIRTEDDALALAHEALDLPDLDDGRDIALAVLQGWCDR